MRKDLLVRVIPKFDYTIFSNFQLLKIYFQVYTVDICKIDKIIKIWVEESSKLNESHLRLKNFI